MRNEPAKSRTLSFLQIMMKIPASLPPAENPRINAYKSLGLPVSAFNLLINDQLFEWKQCIAEKFSTHDWYSRK